MSSFSKPRPKAYVAGGTILKGHAVKISTSPDQVTECTTTTQKSIGIAMNDAASGEAVQVALPGGGALGKAQTTIAAGKLLVSHTDGTLKPIAAANDRVIGMAMQDAVAGDEFGMEVFIAQATATES